MLLGGPLWAVTAMVWSQADGDAINVYYSPDSQHTVPLTSAGVNISPNLFRAQDSTWVTWVDKTEHNDNKLEVARLSATGAMLGIDHISTTYEDIYAPAISVDPQNKRVWLVWVEYNGDRENLYASYRGVSKRDAQWKPALQITPDSRYSANLPSILVTGRDGIEINWMRTSPESSESATAQLSVSAWLPQTARSSSDLQDQNKSERYRSLRLSRVHGYDTFMRKLKAGQALSADEQQWKNRVRNKNVLMGSVQTGSNVPKRLLDEAK